MSMTIPYWQIDSFADEPFGGNPAAVVYLENALPDAVMQKLAMEINQSETAFILKKENGYLLRWMTPRIEVDLCGHATLAAAHVLFAEIGIDATCVVFDTVQAGQLTVDKIEAGYRMDFPSRPGAPVDPATIPGFAIEALGGVKPLAAFKSRDMMLVYENEEIVKSIEPNFSALQAYDEWIILTAPGDKTDAYSRFICAGDGIDEDPVTGSAHCTIVPYWAERLGKTRLHCAQFTPYRGGYIDAELAGDRVLLSGKALTVIRGQVSL